MNERLLTDEEIRGISLISEYSFRGVRDVIEETCYLQDIKTAKAVRKDIGSKILSLAGEAADFPAFHAEMVVFANSLVKDKEESCQG